MNGSAKRGLRLAAMLALAAAGCEWGALAAMRVTVSQQDRVFHPGMLDVARGDTVTIVNDDGELIHHAYVETDDFKFDSGEQEPGSTTDIRFTKSGTFTVRCRIHPKMSLVVTVK